MNVRVGALLSIAAVTCGVGLAQRGETATGFSLVGLWSGMYHEDELERTDPGPPPGDIPAFPSTTPPATTPTPGTPIWYR